MYEQTDLESARPLRQAYDGQLTEISAQKAHWDLHRSLLSETLSLGKNMDHMFMFPYYKKQNKKTLLFTKDEVERDFVCVCVILFKYKNIQNLTGG